MQPDPEGSPPDSGEVLAALWGRARRPTTASSEQGFYGSAERLFGRPWRSRRLTPKVRALIQVALNGTVTQLDRSELGRSIDAAVSAGADRAEVMCTLQLASVIGLHSCSVAIPELVSAMKQADPERWSRQYTAEQRQIAEAFESSGPRPRPVDGMFDAILRLDHEYFSDYAAFLDQPWESTALDPAIKELVWIAIDVACTHLYVDGIRRHIRAALDGGVTTEEIFEVIQLASATGLRTLGAAGPLLEAAFADEGSTSVKSPGQGGARGAR